jgi:hypothetical protein
MANQIQLRRDTSTNWSSINPILAQGEIGVNTTTSPYTFKFGNGVDNWNTLPYQSTGGGGGSTTWGAITGTLSAQGDLQNALNAKQAALVSGTNIKTVFGISLVGSGDVSIKDLPLKGGFGVDITDLIAISNPTTGVSSKTSVGSIIDLFGSGSGSSSGGILSLNNLTQGNQLFATSTTGTDFSISSSLSTHTFNLPTASATARGLLSSANWTAFSNKPDALTLTPTGTSGAATLVG